ncbi:EFR1 family ferrodoxin [Prolixibacter denitrificans]|uniref:(Fe-S)-binding protein n=1 Tax=Prolixibacter denitrificans TaxID=1541063 RepID=A0A2P8CKQ0_9BACT|nr:EFR1 family ferrodoxin [Prolixibacter denitrificans]PSK85531.1 4Fe-4S binding protein [Prolixibacter denitrificans]GET20152.1 (Fe-S)-binding protein [Prolixibacter denitrificans]
MHIVYFSPTHTTRQVLERITNGVNSNPVKHIDLTLSSSAWEAESDEITIFGVPVYGGRVPAEATHRLKQIKGNQTPAVVVVVYGNRAYEDALLELRDIVTEQGFVPIAAAAFIGEHSYTTSDYLIAPGRPDTNDLQKADDFGKKINELLLETETLSPIAVPGNFPYKPLGQKPPIAPVTVAEKCDQCGICVSVCPTDAITLNDLPETNASACILCCACIKECPTDARVNDSEFIKEKSQWLVDNYSERKEPEVFVE